MAKRRRQKKVPKARPQSVKRPPNEADTAFLNALNFFSVWCATLGILLWSGAGIYQFLYKRSVHLWIFATFIAFLVVHAIRTSMADKAIILILKRTVDSFKEARSPAVWLLVMSVFQVVIGIISVLYASGKAIALMALIQNQVPTKQVVGEKTSLAIAFSTGAIVSGVLGNLAYDLLKFLTRKAKGKSVQ